MKKATTTVMQLVMMPVTIGRYGSSTPYEFCPRSKRASGNPAQNAPQTKYQAAYSAAYKRLKKKHPRMSFGSLSKKAHAAARKKVK